MSCWQSFKVQFFSDVAITRSVFMDPELCKELMSKIKERADGSDSQLFDRNDLSQAKRLDR